jgi:hypothetical protein
VNSGEVLGYLTKYSIVENPILFTLSIGLAVKTIVFPGPSERFPLNWPCEKPKEVIKERIKNMLINFFIKMFILNVGL